MVFDGFRADTLFIEEFDGRAEEVMEGSPFAAIEFIKSGDDKGFVYSLVTKPLSDMRPVFLFTVRVIVFVIGSGAREADGLFSLREVPQEMLVEEPGTVIGIEA